MALLAVSYPDLNAQDFEWIQQLRARYDKRHHLIIRPHLTLVFPVDKIDRPRFVDHIHLIAERTAIIMFVINRALAVSTPTGDECHVFLVPDTGYSDIVSLHDSLYTGRLAGELKPDYPFV
ncbi:MAG: 2'-5' RNA ligase family protein, partial [Candidatus Zixiibacteriota bacterium]